MRDILNIVKAKLRRICTDEEIVSSLCEFERFFKSYDLLSDSNISKKARMINDEIHILKPLIEYNNDNNIVNDKNDIIKLNIFEEMLKDIEDEHPEFFV